MTAILLWAFQDARGTCISQRPFPRGQRFVAPQSGNSCRMAQPAAATSGAENEHTHRRVWALALGSIGVVFGDIGTSPLYALRVAVSHANQQGAAGADAVVGIVSLLTWTLLG